jgi:hypothetical protein
VWSEPSVVEAAAYEFADTAKFLETGGEQQQQQQQQQPRQLG